MWSRWDMVRSSFLTKLRIYIKIAPDGRHAVRRVLVRDRLYEDNSELKLIVFTVQLLNVFQERNCNEIVIDLLPDCMMYRK